MNKNIVNLSRTFLGFLILSGGGIGLGQVYDGPRLAFTILLVIGIILSFTEQIATDRIFIVILCQYPISTNTNSTIV